MIYSQPVSVIGEDAEKEKEKEVCMNKCACINLTLMLQQGVVWLCLSFMAVGRAVAFINSAKQSMKQSRVVYIYARKWSSTWVPHTARTTQVYFSDFYKVQKKSALCHLTYVYYYYYYSVACLLTLNLSISLSKVPRGWAPPRFRVQRERRLTQTGRWIEGIQ